MVTVSALPVVGGITGTAHECVGATSTLSDATLGGVWSSSNVAVATVGSSSGIVMGVASGTATITYAVTNSFGCSAQVSTVNTVNTTPVVLPITGPAGECVGTTIALSDATPGGSWSSSNPSVATVGGTGIVTGMSTGSATISYSVSSGGCAGLATVSNSVSTAPVASAITGATHVCTGATTALADGGTGGMWSSSNPSVAAIGTDGVVTGVAAGTAEIYYSTTNSCGSVTDSASMSVQASPAAGTISGLSSVCQGGSITLTDAAGGGVWSVTNAHATVGSSSGIVTGASAGVDTVKYTVANTCGSAVATKTISVGASAYPGSISGYTSVCAGHTIALSESITGGTWSSGNPAVATVSGGVVTGIAVGSATISYAVSNSCGTRYATHPVSVVPGSQCNVMVTGTNAPDEIRVYPNPATTTLNIEAPVRVNVIVITVEGKTVITERNVATLDISALPNGMYFINIYDEKDVLLKTAKFAKTE